MLTEVYYRARVLKFLRRMWAGWEEEYKIVHTLDTVTVELVVFEQL
jgi:hypothetical protein